MAILRTGYWLAWDDKYYYILHGERVYLFKLPKDKVVSMEKREVGTFEKETMWIIKTKGGYKITVRENRYETSMAYSP